MSVSLTIDGNERSDVVEFKSLRRSNRINDKTDTLKFDILRGGNKNFTPQEGNEIILIINGIKEFGGIIIRLEYNLEAPKIEKYTVTCKDYVQFFDRELVTRNYTGTTVEDIIENIIEDFTSGFTGTNVVAPINVASISFNRLTPSKCIQKLAEKTNFHWYIDYDKDVHFKSKSSELAPFNLTDDDSSVDYGKYNYLSLQMEKDLSQIRNVILVEGGEQKGIERTITRVGEEISTEGVLNLEYKFAEKPTVKVDSIEQNVGIDFLDDELSFDVMWNFNEKYLKFTAGNIPTSEEIIEMSGEPLYPILVEVPDEDSIAEFGRYEHAIEDNTIRSDDEAIERAIAEISAYGDSIVEGSFKTYETGLRAGQRINIKDSFRNIDELVLIQQADMKAITPTGDRLEFSIKYATLKTMGIIDFLQEQVLTETLREGQVESLISLIRLDDEADFSDTLEQPTTRTGPFKWSPSSDSFKWNFGLWH